MIAMPSDRPKIGEDSVKKSSEQQQQQRNARGGKMKAERKSKTNTSDSSSGNNNREVSLSIDFELAKDHRETSDENMEYLDASLTEAAAAAAGGSGNLRQVCEVDYPITAVEKYLKIVRPDVECTRKCRMLLKDLLTLFIKNVTLLAMKELSKTNRKILMPTDFGDALKEIGFADIIPEKKLYEIVAKKRNSVEFNQKMSDPETYKKMLEMQNKLFEHARSQENIKNSIDYATIQENMQNVIKEEDMRLKLTPGNACEGSQENEDINFDED